MNLPPEVERKCLELSGQAAPPTKRRKYRNEPCEVNGIRFASKKEAQRYGVLRVLERTGFIRDLKPHPCYDLVVNGIKVGRYTADSRYIEAESGDLVVEDVKSKVTKTTAYRLRKRLMLACHGIEIREV